MYSRRTRYYSRFSRSRVGTRGNSYRRRYTGGYGRGRISGGIKRYVSNYYNRQTRRNVAPHTRQLNNFLSFSSAANENIFIEFPTMTAQQYEAMGVLTPYSNEKIMVNQIRDEVIVVNQTNLTLHMRVLRLKCRRDFDGNVAPSVQALMNIDAPSVTAVPYIDPTTGTLFRKHFRILSSRKMHMAGGRSRTFKRNIYSRSGMMVSGEIEGRTNMTAYRGQYYTIIIVSSMPYIETQEGQGDSGLPGTARVLLACSHITKIVYRLIEDNDPDTRVVDQATPYVNRPVVYNTGVAVYGRSADQTQPLPPVNVAEL